MGFVFTLLFLLKLANSAYPQYTSMKISFVDPKTKIALVRFGNQLKNIETQEVVAEISKNIPRFVRDEDNYAKSFGWQWNKWSNNRSTLRDSNFDLKQLIFDRTHFDKYELEGKTILECGMGGGDDTEALIQLPFSEIHSFDMSNSVNRAAKYIKDDRLVISQASIYDIPYADEVFDVVFCHRVLQHTPDPIKSLKAICKKVKPGGLLFAHAYKRSPKYMAEWRYKYLWLTQKLPISFIYWYVELFGWPLHVLIRVLNRFPFTRSIPYKYIPFYHKRGNEVRTMSRRELLELEKLITFDALTPAHDHPMSSDEFFGTIEKQGFKIEHKHDPEVTPLFCTAIKIPVSNSDTGS